MLPLIISVVAGIHTLGAAAGAFGSLFAEIFYAKATRDGKIDTRERDYLSITYKTLSWGMMTVLITSILLTGIGLAYPVSTITALSTALWMQITLIFVILLFAWLLSRSQVSWWVGSSVVFSGWWMFLLLDVFPTNLPYTVLAFAYLIFVFICAAVWGYVRVIAMGVK